VTPVDIYLRVSRVGKRENLISPDEQERRARALAQGKGLAVGEVFTDLDESGGKWDRPGLQAILERVKLKESGGVIVAWLDRLSRDSEHAQRLLREIDEAGGKVYAPDAPEDMTTPEGELMVGIQFQFAQYVRKRAKEGFERAKANSIAQGVPINTRAPIGYVKGEDRRLTIDPVAAPLVRKVFEARVMGQSFLECAQIFQEAGISTSQGSAHWTRQAVTTLIKNRVYLGEISYGKDLRYVNTDAHDPIVDLPTWQAAQSPSEKPKRAVAGTYLLTGLLRCSSCGYTLQGTKNGRGTQVYRCVRHHAGGTCPSPLSIIARAVEPAVVDAFWSITDNITASTTPEDLSTLTEALGLAERRLAQAMTPEVQDAAGEGWAAMIKERRAERDAAAEALGRAQGATRRLDSRSLRQLWDKLDIAERRDLLADLIDVVVLFDVDGVKSIDVYATGNGPDGLSRRGFYRNPGLRPVDGPRSPIVLAK
jgi:DNA invertase Pin-like site-specific DNA recombinase